MKELVDWFFLKNLISAQCSFYKMVNHDMSRSPGWQILSRNSRGEIFSSSLGLLLSITLHSSNPSQSPGKCQMMAASAYLEHKAWLKGYKLIPIIHQVIIQSTHNNVNKMSFFVADLV